MSIKIITNNSLTKNKFKETEFVEGSYIDVLKKTRDLLHQGWSLVNHPLPASIRMFFSPVRSIVIEKSEDIDENSIMIIEDSIDKYTLTMESRKVDRKNKDDYESVDLMLLEAALNEHKTLSSLEN